LIGGARNVEDHGNTGNNPLVSVVLSLKLGFEHVGAHTINSLVHGALVDGLVDLIVHDGGLAVNNGHN